MAGDYCGTAVVVMLKIEIYNMKLGRLLLTFTTLSTTEFAFSNTKKR